MKLTASYGVSFKDGYSAVKQTIDIYRSAVEYLFIPIADNWDEIKVIKGAKSRQRYVERLVHSCKGRDAQYDFDERFYKLPSYFRRAAITDAIGCYSSYRTNHDNWEQTHEGKEPKLGVDYHTLPCFYRDNMFVQTGVYTAKIKVYRSNDWVWQDIRLKKTDVDYLFKRTRDRYVTVNAPVIEKHYGHYELRFTLTENVEFADKPIEDRKVCAVDLGVNTDAVCSVLDVRGTVLARKFITCGREKDSVRNALHAVSRFQHGHGSHDSGKLWAVAKNRNLNLGHLIAHRIVDFAVANDCDVIVFEHLDTAGKKHGSRKQRLHHWKHQAIQKTAESLAHRYGIRISRVCAWNTSRLAYDGSGRISRGEEVSKETPYDVCKFNNGKICNCDLNASYNIGARYFLRALIKEKPQVMAEVPDLGSGTQRVLADLWRAGAAVFA